MFEELLDRFGFDYTSADLSTVKFEFTFAIIPKGGRHSEARDYDSILNKKSVVKIINDDDNCFWYSLACCMNPQNKLVKDSRYPNTRIKIGSEICKNAIVTGVKWYHFTRTSK